jgi:hypothetical protein
MLKKVILHRENEKSFDLYAPPLVHMNIAPSFYLKGFIETYNTQEKVDFGLAVGECALFEIGSEFDGIINHDEIGGWYKVDLQGNCEDGVRKALDIVLEDCKEDHEIECGSCGNMSNASCSDVECEGGSWEYDLDDGIWVRKISMTFKWPESEEDMKKIAGVRARR